MSMLKENPTTLAEEAYLEQMITEAIVQAHEKEQPEQSTILVTENQEQMAVALRKALGLAFGVTLNSAVKYALFHAQYKGIMVNQLEEYPKRLGSHPLKLKVTAETLFKLKEAGLTENLSECVVAGIQLLYEHLIALPLKSTSK